MQKILVTFIDFYSKEVVSIQQYSRNHFDFFVERKFRKGSTMNFGYTYEEMRRRYSMQYECHVIDLVDNADHDHTAYIVRDVDYIKYLIHVDREKHNEVVQKYLQS